MNPKIFKAYDIRGIWGKDWDTDAPYLIGKGIVSYLKPSVVAIGRDMRTSSPVMFEQLSKALAEEGVQVKDLGLCGTELSYFAVNYYDVDVAIMITASHNPGEYNGMKITTKDGPIGLASGLDKIRDYALGYERVEKTIVGSVEEWDLWDAYREHVFSLAGVRSGTGKVVIDPGNGVGGYMFDKVLGDLPLEVVKINWEPNGNFPHHIPDPFVESNVEVVKQKVKESGADLGISYDGDSDRIFLVDETGRYIPGYYTAAILSEYFLKRHPGETIGYDPRYYRATVDVIKKNGGTPLKTVVGHTLIKAMMKKSGSYFAAECSGHIYYKENKFAESTMYTTLLFLTMIKEKKLSEIVEPYFKNYPISGEINFVVDDTAAVLAKIESFYDGVIDKLDGVSFDFPDWRFNVRASNTQPLLRLNVEGSKEIISEKVSELKGLIGGKIVEE